MSHVVSFLTVGKLPEKHAVGPRVPTWVGKQGGHEGAQPYYASGKRNRLHANVVAWDETVKRTLNGGLMDASLS